MTSAEFDTKYKLLRSLSERGARTYLAQEAARRRFVLVHRFDADIGTDDVRRRLASRLASLAPDAREKVLESTDIDGTPTVVTLFETSFKDLPTWLDENGAVEAPPAPAPVVPPAAKSGPGEFTRLFAASTPAAAPAAPAPAPTPALASVSSPGPTLPMSAVRPQSPPSAPAATAGEFTRLFMAGGGVPAEPAIAAPAVTPPPAPPPAPAVREPAPKPAVPVGDGFTAIFGGVQATAPRATPAVSPPAAPLRPASPPPLQVPRMAPSGGAAGSIIPPVRAMPVDAPPLAPAPPPATPKGEFTQMFDLLSGRPAPSAPPPAAAPPPPMAPRPQSPPPPAPASAPLAAPQFAMPAAPNFRAAGAPPAPAAPVAAYPAAAGGGRPAGPSEFTQVMSASATPVQPAPIVASPVIPGAITPVAAPVAAQPAHPAPAKTIKDYIVLILALNVLLIVAVSLIWYFALRH